MPRNLPSPFASNEPFLPRDYRSLRITLIVVSVLLLLTGVLGVVLLVLLFLDPGGTGDDDVDIAWPGVVAVMGCWIYAQMLKLFPCEQGYKLARRNEYHSSSLVVGAVWSISAVLFYGLLFCGLAWGRASLLGLVVFGPFIFVPIIWTCSMAALGNAIGEQSAE